MSGELSLPQSLQRDGVVACESGGASAGSRSGLTTSYRIAFRCDQRIYLDTLEFDRMDVSE